jgi:predicted alpha/beta hydrolase
VMKERYLFGDSTLDTRENFHNYKGPLRALCFVDDPWATRTAVELLCSGFSATKPEIVSITPADAGVKKIGHFGFFRAEHLDTLWRGAAEWLQAEQ